MNQEIKVWVVEFADRKHYQMQYRDPITGRKKTLSTKVVVTGLKRDRTVAERVAAKWESELREGRYHDASKITWADFRERYESEVLESLAGTTDRKVSGVFNTIEEIIHPAKLRDLSPGRLSHYQAELRKRELSENTIKGHMAHLGAALNWAHRMGLLPVVPCIERPRRAKGSKVMKGRPITGEEFDRMLAAVPKVVTPEPKPDAKKPKKPAKAKSDPEREAAIAAERAAVAESWRHYLRGVWTSGLRLAESLELYWDRDDKLCVDLTGKRPMLRIPAELEKGHKDRHLAIAPEFAEFLLKTPVAERTGHVFAPLARRVKGPRLTEHRVGELVSKIGKAAGVKVNTDPRTGVVKYASAHDLRRSFGERWASRIMPQALMELMRHENIETTMKFYVGRNAQATAELLWQAVASLEQNSGQCNSLCNSDQQQATE